MLAKFEDCVAFGATSVDPTLAERRLALPGCSSVAGLFGKAQELSR